MCNDVDWEIGNSFLAFERSKESVISWEEAVLEPVGSRFKLLCPVPKTRNDWVLVVIDYIDRFPKTACSIDGVER